MHLFLVFYKCLGNVFVVIWFKSILIFVPIHMHTQADMQSVVDHSLKNFEAKFRYFSEHIDLMDFLFEATFSPLVRKEKGEREMRAEEGV